MALPHPPYLLLWILALLCWACPGGAWAQRKAKDSEKAKSQPPAQTYRAEVEADSFNDFFDVQPLPDTSLLLIGSKRDPWFSKNKFTITKYDRTLQPVWHREYEQKPGSRLAQFTSEREKTYLLYNTRETKKLLLYQLDHATGKLWESEHLLPNNHLEIREIKALNGQLFLYGLENAKLTILYLSPSLQEIRLLPAVFGMEDDLGDFRVDTLARAAEFVVAESNGIRSRLQTKRLSPQGDVLGTYFLQPSMDPRHDNTLLTARLTPGDTLGKLMIGTYGYRSVLFARGLFSSSLTGNVTYYDFSKLQYFFEYLPPRREKKLKQKFARQEAQGKPLILRYRLLLHPILPHPQGYAVVGEIYYPQYRSGSYNITGPNPGLGPLPETRRMFDGYRFTHAIAAVFDRQGKLLWDNSYLLGNDTYTTLAPTVEAGVSPEGNITLVYPKEDVLKFKTLKPNLSLANDDEFTVRTAQESEKMLSSDHEGIVNWYGNNFIAFGFQRIRPEKGAARTVFILQNLLFE